VDATIKRCREGYVLVVVANDIDTISSGFSSAMTRFNEAAQPDGRIRRTDFPRVNRHRTTS
jgi:hypothetical protein